MSVKSVKRVSSGKASSLEDADAPQPVRKCQCVSHRTANFFHFYRQRHSNLTALGRILP